jgi:glucosamine-6-phosphate deaminase
VKFEILSSPAEVARRAASLLEQAVSTKPGLVLALPTGNTPIEMYRLLAEARKAGRLELNEAATFNLDEVLLPKSAPQTFFQFMTRHVWAPLGVPPERRFIPDGEAADPEAECGRYEALIAERNGLDLAILGIGADGHIAYNLPGQVQARTHVVSLDSVNIATLGPEIQGPVRAITMGVGTILSARRILLLATGSKKAEALRRMREAPVSGEWPCTFLRDHTDLTVIADGPAAAQL